MRHRAALALCSQQLLGLIVTNWGLKLIGICLLTTTETRDPKIKLWPGPGSL